VKIEKLTVENWFRYRGKHDLTLEAGVYAVTASMVGDEGRSNWLGKSTLLSAIAFALYGWHLARTEDEWITYDEPNGGVFLQLDSGVAIARARKRGKSTQLAVTTNGTILAGDEAQTFIEEHVGLNQADFFATCFFEQKQMARLITAKPAERMEIVSAWLDLGPFQRCEENILKKLSTLTEQDTKLAQREAVVIGLVADTYTRHQLKDHADPDKLLERSRSVLAGEYERLSAKLDAARAERERIIDWQHAAAQAEKFAAVSTEGKALRAKVDAVDMGALSLAVDDLSSGRDDAVAALTTAQGSTRTLRVLARGAFDGRCPVAEIECPAKTVINGMRNENAKKLEVATKAEQQASLAVETYRDEHRKVEQKIRAVQADDARLTALREQATELKVHAARIKADGLPPPMPDLGPLRTDAEEVAKQLADVETSQQKLEEWGNELASLTNDRDALAVELGTLREALTIFGRNGAQRRRAEGAIAEIEQGANGLLADAGIDLEIGVRWAREGQGLAVHCDACGAPFPASQRVKKCERCGATRGPKLVEKLDIDLSDRSGAAEDLAGIAFQLAAGGWLRRSRGTPWSVACIDEPFGSLDESNRRALSVHLAAMLRGRYGFAQAFVIAHDRGIMDAMPKRLEIEATEAGSVPRVVA
jgi:DNA repair exonuclease SbcCD ATPase subunit